MNLRIFGLLGIFSGSCVAYTTFAGDEPTNISNWFKKKYEVVEFYGNTRPRSDRWGCRGEITVMGATRQQVLADGDYALEKIRKIFDDLKTDLAARCSYPVKTIQRPSSFFGPGFTVKVSFDLRCSDKSEAIYNQ